MYSIIEIKSGNIIQTYQTYEECVKWLDSEGNILDYTIIKEE
jgi:hypothetical protein